MTKGVVKLVNAVLDVVKIPSKKADGRTDQQNFEERMILRGIIDPETVHEIQFDSYQREVGTKAKITALADAISSSTVPDVELGMRGDEYSVHTNGNGVTVFTLKSPVFGIDGLQRLTALKFHLQRNPNSQPRIGAVVHIDTTAGWEKERFRILNQERTKLNANVLLRNLHDENEAIDMVLKLSYDEEFVLANRVQWAQRMARNEIIPGLLLCKTIGTLHTRFGPGRSNDYHELARQLNKTMGAVGRTTMRDNIKTFYELLDGSFGVRRITYADTAVHMKGTFLCVLADLLARCPEFWRGKRLFVEADLRAKIAKFPITDPEVMRLASAGGQARFILFDILINHINSGKRTRRIKPDIFPDGTADEEAQQA